MIRSIFNLSLFLFILPLSVSAQNKVPRSLPSKTQVEKNRFGVVSLGLDYRGERNTEQSTVPRSWTTLSAGIGQKPWMGSIEYATFNESSGNSALTVSHKAETLLLWGHWFTDDPWPVQPFMGLGLGVYRNSADIRIYDQEETSQGKWIEHLSGSVGVKLNDIAPFWVSAEARVHVNRDIDPNPTISGLVKFGFAIDGLGQ